MKKIVTLILVAALSALLLCGCKYGECDLCGDKGMLTERTFFGTTLYLCDDCGG